MFVLVDHIEGDRHRFQLGRRNLGQGELDLIARSHLVALGNRDAVAPHQAGLKSALQRRPAVRSERLRQHLVGAGAANLWGNRVGDCGQAIRT